MRKKIVAGNWKMNTLPAEGVELAKNIVAGRGEVCSCVNFIVCPPFTHLSTVAEALKGSDVALGAQGCERLSPELFLFTEFDAHIVCF